MKVKKDWVYITQSLFYNELYDSLKSYLFTLIIVPLVSARVIIRSVSARVTGSVSTRVSGSVSARIAETLPLTLVETFYSS